MNKIPSDEGLDRASKMMEQQFQGLDAVEAAVVNHLKNSCPLYDFCILPQGDDGFRAYIFFNTDEDIQKCTEAGIVEDIKACVYEELERAGRGKQGEIEVAFELDSHENVTANFEGNYFFRLRCPRHRLKYGYNDPLNFANRTTNNRLASCRYYADAGGLATLQTVEA